MEPDPLDYLRDNQISIGLKLLRHCQILAAKLHGWTPNHPLPQGKDPQDIVVEMIGKYLDEERVFSPEWPLETQLKKAIQRRLEWLMREADSQVASLDELMVDDENAAGSSSIQPPDEAAANKIDSEVLWQLIWNHDEVKRDEDLQLLLLAISDDKATTSPEQAAATGLPVKQIYELRDKLRSVYRAVLPEYHKGGILQ
jgi:hypothetical protein